MLFRFIVLSGPAKGERITIGKEPLLVGRDPSCTLVLRDEEIAAKHAVVEQRGEHLSIRDLGSMGKILVNGLEVAKARIKHGDVVEIGRTRFLVEALMEAEVSRAYGGGVGGRVLVVLTYAAAPIILLSLLAFAQHRLLGVRVGAAVVESPRPSVPVPSAAPAGGGSATQASAAVSRVVPKPVPVPKPTVSNAAELARVAEERRRVQDDLKGIRGVIDEVAAVPAPVVSNPPVAFAVPPVKDSAPGVVASSPERQPARGTRALRILSVNQNRFQESDEFDEMRVVDVRVGSEESGRPDIKAVQVQITFYDQDSRTGEVVPSRAIVPKGPIGFRDAWQEDGQSVTASYVVPKGFRLKEATAGRLERYYGYVVRVYYRGALQDEEARPKTLLQYSTGTRAGGQGVGSRVGETGQESAAAR